MSEAEVSATAFVPLSFDPGKAFQFDWSHEIAIFDGVTTTIKVAHVRLYYRRMIFVRAYPRETQEMVFDAHDKVVESGTVALKPSRRWRLLDLKMPSNWLRP